MSVLKEICNNKRLEINSLKEQFSESDLIEISNFQKKPRGFKNALTKKVTNNKYALIAEVKKASPSRGIIKEDFNPIEIATSYLNGGAACLSVLTEIKWFKGSINYLIDIQKSVNLPILRKDFIIDPWQIYESRSIGADCILIILAAVDDILAKEMIVQTRDLGMDVLIEAHSEKEIERAINLKADLIGINNRNLKTLEIDINNTIRLSKLIPKEYDIICESGLNNNNDLKIMEKNGIMRFLVGESLMRKSNIEEATRKLIHKD
jgi:indole-3-glycerol phosphate synthase